MDKERISFFDLLRGIAILLVFINHIPHNSYLINEGTLFIYKKIFLFGTYGVQLFYIVSAITLMISLYRKNQIDVKKFYIKRIFRIVPIFYLGILLHILYFSFFSQYNNELLDLKNIILNVSFLNNIIPPSNDLILGGSTIATEMNFYLILPFFYFFINSYLKSLIFSLLYLILIFLFNRASFNLFDGDLFGNANFYRTIFVQMYVFSLGLNFFYIFKEKLLENEKIINLKNLNKIIPHIFIAILIFIFEKSEPEYFYFRNMLFVSTVFFIIVSIFFTLQSKFNNNIILKLIEKIGRMSFSMYILHWITIDISWRILSHLNYFNYFIVFFIFVSLFLTIIVSYYFYKLEILFINYGKSFLKN